MKKLILSIAATIGISVAASAQNGISANDYQYQQTVIVSNLLLNAAQASTNLLPGASANVSTPIPIHGDSLPFGLFLNAQWNTPTGTSNTVTLNFLPATKFSQTNGAGTAGGYLIQTNTSPVAVNFINLGGTNTGVLYGILYPTNFFGADTAILSSIAQTNTGTPGGSGTFTLVGGSFH